MEKTETWKPVVGYEGCYEVSDLGRVKSVSRTVYNRNIPQRGDISMLVPGKILALSASKIGYMRATLSKNGVHKLALVHRLVMQAFNGASNLQVDHIDGDKRNNQLSNLEYVTGRENQTRARSKKRNLPTGVSLTTSGKYVAQYGYRGKHYNVGTHDCPIKAGEAYSEAISKLRE